MDIQRFHQQSVSKWFTFLVNNIMSYKIYFSFSHGQMGEDWYILKLVCDSYIIQTVQITLKCTNIIWYEMICVVHASCVDLFSQFQTERFIRWDIPRPCSVSYWGIQWDNLCLWTDRHWKNIHNARYESQMGDCGWVRMTNNLIYWCTNYKEIWILSRSQEWSWITRCYTKLFWAHISTHCQNRESTVPHSSLISGDLPSKAPLVPLIYDEWILLELDFPHEIT